MAGIDQKVELFNIIISTQYSVQTKFENIRKRGGGPVPNIPGRRFEGVLQYVIKKNLFVVF